MRISFKRKTDDTYLFQHITSKDLVFLRERKEGFVLLSLNEKGYAHDKTALAEALIAGMLEQGMFSERAEDIEIVETEAIEFPTPGQ